MIIKISTIGFMGGELGEGLFIVLRGDLVGTGVVLVEVVDVADEVEPVLVVLDGRWVAIGGLIELVGLGRVGGWVLVGGWEQFLCFL